MMRVRHHLRRLFGSRRSAVRHAAETTVRRVAPALGEWQREFEPLEQRMMLSSTWVAEGPWPVDNGQVENIAAGPNAVVGAINAVAAHPTDVNTLYAGSANGGVWKTENAASANPRWIPLTDSMPSLSIGSLDIDPTDPSGNTVVAGIGRYSSWRGEGGPLSGVLYTTDGGSTWTNLSAGLAGENISFAAARGSTILAASNLKGVGGGPGGLFRSAGGGSFLPLSDPDTGTFFTDVPDMIGNPLDASEFFISVLPDTGSGYAGGIFHSGDTGATWTNISAGSVVATDGLINANTISMEFAHGLHDELYLAVVNYTGTGSRAELAAIYRTDDDGVTWKRLPNLPLTFDLGGTFGVHPKRPAGQGYFHFSIAADPSNGNILYVGGDRQPGNMGALGSDYFSAGGMNSIGAVNFTGRVFRGELGLDGALNLTAFWTPLTHVGSVPTTTVTHNITGVSSGGGNIVITSAGHGLANNDVIGITGVHGTTSANGAWKVTNVTANTFELASSTANAPYQSGGVWYRYTDASGKTTGSAPHADSRDIIFDSAGSLVEVDDGGIYRRDIPQSILGTWEALAGNLQVTEFLSADYDSVSNTIIGGTQDNGVVMQRQDGTWTPIPAGPSFAAFGTPVSWGDGAIVAIDDTSTAGSSWRYSSAWRYGDLRRQQFDANGVPMGAAVNPALIVAGSGGQALATFDSKAGGRSLQPIVVNETNGQRLILATGDTTSGSIYESLDQADNLTQLGTAATFGLPTAIAYGGGGNIESLYIGNTAGQIFVRDAGLGTPTLRATLAGSIVDIAVDPNDWENAWAITSVRAYHTIDGGDNWTPITNVNLSMVVADPAVPDFRTVAIIPAGAFDIIAVGTRDGVIAMSSDLPGVWADLGEGMPNVVVSDLRYDPADDVLLAGTLGRGAWTLESASDALSFTGKAGDIIKVDLSEMISATTYSLSSVELVGPGTALTVDTVGVDWVIRDGLTPLGTIILADRLGTGTFASNGRFYFAPSLVDGLANDADPAARGFQGVFQLTFTTTGSAATGFVVQLEVGGGYSSAGDSAVGITADALNVVRVQQRLNYLGWRDNSGVILPLTGLLDLTTTPAVQLFQAAVDPNGTLQPGSASGTMDLFTAGWLNAANAPVWTTDAAPTNILMQYATDWLVLTVNEATADVPGFTVLAYSPIGGWPADVLYDENPSSPLANPGRLHKLGMEVDFAMPAGAQTASGGVGLNADETSVVNLITAIQTRAKARGLKVVQVVTPNTKIIDAINTTAGLEGTASNGGGAAYGPVLHIGLAAPILDAEVAANEQQQMLNFINTLRRAGELLEARANEVVETVANADIPFIDFDLKDIVDLGGIFDDLAGRLLDPVTISGTATPANNTLLSDTTFTVSIDGQAPILVTLDDSVFAGNATAQNIADDLNTIFAGITWELNGRPLSDYLVASIDGSGRLVLTTPDSGLAASITLSTLALKAANAAAAYGQLASDLVFNFSITEQDTDPAGLPVTNVSAATVTVHASDTIDNALPEDLAADINNALIAAAASLGNSLLLHIYAVVDPADGKIIFVTDDAQITRIDITGGSNLSGAGFTAGAFFEASSSQLTTRFSLTAQRVIAEPKFDSIPELMGFLGIELQAVSSRTLPLGFDLEWEYDTETETLEFNLALNKDYTLTSVGFDLTDGLPIGSLGTIEFTAMAESEVRATIDLNLRVGVFLGNLGDSFTLTGGTLLSSLNSGEGVTFNVGITATSYAPANGKLAADSTINIAINGGTPVAVTVTAAATTDNFDPFALAADLNAALVAEDIDDQVQAIIKTDRDAMNNILGRYIMLVGKGDTISLSTTGGSALGFAASQSGDRADLEVIVNATSYLIELDGAKTVQDVINAIQTQASGAVAVTINAEQGLTVTTTTPGLPLTILAPLEEDIRSNAAFMLGVFGTSADGIIEGDALHGEDFNDRLYLVEPEAGDSNLKVGIELEATNIDLRAALGLLEIAVTDCATDPILISVSVDVIRLVDPGTGENADGKITLDELSSASLTDVIALGASQSSLNIDVQGCLELSDSILSELAGGGPLAMVSFGLATPNDLSSLEFTADTTGLESAISELQNLSIEQVITLVSGFVDMLKSSDMALLNIEIPLLEVSLNDVITVADDFLDAITGIAASIDPTALENARDALETAISNIADAPANKQHLRDAVNTILSVLEGDEDRMASRLVSAAAEAREKITDYLATRTNGPLEQELSDALDSLLGLVPSMNTLEQRIEDEVTEWINGLIGDGIGVVADFNLGFVDFNGDGDNDSMVLGLTFTANNLVSLSFTPEIPTVSFGPLQIGASPSFTLHAGGTIGFGLGLYLNGSTPEPFLIVDPPGGNPDLVKTQLQLTAGFDGSFSGGVEFGALEAVQADATLRMATAQKETLNVVGGTVTLAAAPLNAEERFVIVADKGTGTVLNYTDFTISGNTITFLGTPPAQVTVEYQTAVPGPTTNPANRASLTFNFDEPGFVYGNAIGAVLFSDLFSAAAPELQIDAKGLITGDVDVEVLNSAAEDAVTLVISLNHLLDPKIVVDEGALADMLANIEFNLCTLAEGVDALLALIEEGLTSEVLSELPVIGEGLNLTGTFIGDLRDNFVTPFKDFICDIGGTFEQVEDTVRRFIFELLGPGLPSEGIAAGLGILGDRTGDGIINLADVHVDLDTEHFEVLVKLYGRDEFTADFDFGLGGMALGAAGQGGVKIGWDYDVDFGLGVSRTGGVYLLTNQGADASKPEMQLQLDVGLLVDDTGGSYNPTQLSLSLFGLTLQATDINSGANPGTYFVGTLGLDIKDPNPADTDARLMVSDMFEMKLSDIFEPSLSADVHANIRLRALVTEDFPSVQADLWATWHFDMILGADGIEVDTGLPHVEFRNIGLNLGDFLSRFIGPVIEDVNEFVEPLKPAIDFLKMEVPGVSEIYKVAGKGPVYMIDLAFMNDPESGASARKFLGILSTIVDTIVQFDTLGGSDVFINFGDLVFDGASGVDLRAPGWNNANDSNFANALNDAAGAVIDLATQILGGGNDSVTAIYQTTSRESDSEGLGGLGIKLAFLEPTSIFNYLLGNPADVITWDIPKLAFFFDWGVKIPVWAVPPISITIGLNVGAFADLSVGFDTRGILTGNFLDGFYFGDRENVSTGADIPEFGFGIGATLGAILDAYIASVGIEGEIRADIQANWRDVDNNGKMYLDEIVNIVETDGLDCLFDLSGQIRAIVRVVWEVLGFDGSYEFINALLLEFKNDCPHYETAHVSDGTDSLPGGFAATSGMMIVHAGAFAHLREPGVSSDTHEAFTITQVAPGVYDVEGMGLKVRYSGVSSIFFDGGKGADSVSFVNVTVPVTVLGGEGSDSLQGTGQNDYIDGGSGNDTIDALGGADRIYGGEGNDTITGGSGADTIDAGGGNDYITGDAGADSILAGAGTDYVDAGGDADYVEGSSGRDTIYGRGGNDTVYGGTGDDSIFGELGSDSLFGDAGHDWIEGGDGSDWIYAGNGNDFIVGGPNKDTLLGGWGNDGIIAHLIADVSSSSGEYIEGGPDDDLICGTNGVDEIYGGTSDIGFSYILADEATAGTPAASGYLTVECDEDPTYTQPEPVTISGMKLRDHDGDGVKDADDEGIAGWLIQVYDEDGDLVTEVTTGSDGTYSVTDLDPGIYTIKEVLQSGYKQTSPAAPGEHSVDLADGEAATNIDFGNQKLGEIHGTKRLDSDGDGYWDNDEKPMGGVLIYIDLDDDGNYDGGEFAEPSTVTATDDPNTPADETGQYAFTDLPPGTYIIREVVPSGYTQTYPFAKEFFYTFSTGAGTEWSKTTTSTAPATGNKFLGQFGNDGVTLTLNDLPNHKQVTVEFDLYVIRSWEGNFGNDRFTFGLQGEPFLLNTTFSNSDDPKATRNQAYPGSYNAGDYAPHTGATGVDTLGYLVGNKAMDSTYHFSFTFEHDADDIAFNWMGLALESLGVKSWGLDNVRVVVGNDKHVVDLGEGEIATGYDFGNKPAPGGISGQKYFDRDGDGKHDPGEIGLDGWTIYIDLNDDGKLDQKNEPWTATADGGYYSFSDLEPDTYTVREVLQPGFVLTDPKEGYHTIVVTAGQTAGGVDFGNHYDPGTVSGHKWYDRNGDGKRQNYEPGLSQWTVYIDVNSNGKWDAEVEPFDITDDQGFYLISNVPAGTWIVREVVQPGWSQSFPTEGFHTVTLQAGGAVTGVDFGNHRTKRPHRVTGTQGNDTVYIDRDDQGNIRIWVNRDPKRDEPNELLPYIELSNLVIETGTGSDTLTLDLKGGRLMPDEGIVFSPDADGTDRLNIAGSSGNDHVRIQPEEGSPEGILIGLNVGPDMIAMNIDAFAFLGGAGDDTLTIAGALPFTPRFAGGMGEDTLHILAGKYELDEDLGATGESVHLVVEGTTNLILPAVQHLAELRIWGDPHVELAGQGTFIDTRSLNIGPDATLDLGTGGIIVRAPSAASGAMLEELTGEIARARNPMGGGLWSGDGLTTSAGSAIRGISILRNQRNGLPIAGAFLGQPVGLHDILIRNSYIGDLDGDGRVDGRDYLLMDYGFLSGGQGHIAGDVDYNGSRDGDDYFLTDRAFLNQTSVLAIAGGAEASEPGIGTISGMKWNDQDKDGVRDATEVGVAGVTVYVDIDNDGVFDAGEPSAVTGSDGSYTISGLAPGQYSVREVLDEGCIQTYPGQRFIGHTFSGGLTNNAILWDIDLATGSLSKPRAVPTTLIGITRSPATGAFYGITTAGSMLHQINPDTGATIAIGTLGLDWFEGDLDFDPTTGSLYAIYTYFQSPAGSGPSLFRVNPATGAATFVGVITAGAGAVARDPSAMAFTASGDLFMLDTGGNRILRVDKNTGAILNSVATSFPNGVGDLAGMDIDPKTGKVYAVAGYTTGGGTGRLYEVNLTTGVLTPIGGTSVPGAANQHLSGAHFYTTDAHLVAVDGRTPVTGINFGNYCPIYIYDGRDMIEAHDGADKVYGDNLVSDPNVVSAGDSDTVEGGKGNDSLYGQDKDDELWGNEGADRIDGGENADGSADADRVLQTVDAHQTLTDGLLTGQGPDTLFDVETATLTGGIGNNAIDASGFTPGGVTIYGEAGNDTLTGSKQNDRIEGGAGNDTISALEGNDNLVGDEGSDRLDGADGTDRYLFAVTATIETDEIVESVGPSGGIDYLDFTALPAGTPVTVDLSSTTIGTHANRTITSLQNNFLEVIFGGAGNDSLTGNGLNNLLIGNAGNDTIKGMGGDDIYQFTPASSPETDIVDDSAGAADWLAFPTLAAADPVTINLMAPAGGNVATHANRTVKSPNPAAFEVAYGGAGDDVMVDGPTSTTLIGSNGDDTYRFLNAAAAQADTIIDTGGIDTLDFGSVNNAITLNLVVNGAFGSHTNRTLNGDGNQLEHVLSGTAGDSITGNAAANNISGNGGNDTILAGAGNDTLVGGTGNDSLEGGTGNDLYLFVPASTAETDTITEDATPAGGNDTLDFSVLPAADALSIDLTGAMPGDQIGSHTNRTLNSTTPNLLETVLAGAGNDSLIGNAAANRLAGGDGNDTIEGQDGNDTVAGGKGDDTYVFKATIVAQIDTLEETPGEGIDRLDFTALTAATPLTVDLSAATTIATHSFRTIVTATAGLGVNFENAYGGAGNDTITGSAANNELYGNDGDDVIDAKQGSDTLNGGAGTNTLKGGSGDDTYLHSIAVKNILFEDSGLAEGGLASGGGSDMISFATIFVGSVYFDLNDAVGNVVSGVSYELHDSTGPTGANFENLRGVGGLFGSTNHLIGNAADNLLIGGSSNDTLTGNGGDDILVGNGGADLIDAGADDDIVIGGAGNDTVTGGAGRDILIGGDNSDSINGGDGEDILIGGITGYDVDSSYKFAALKAIRSAWKSTANNFATRQASIAAGVGAGVGSPFRLDNTAPDNTIDDDGDIDTLLGGLLDDWLLFNAGDSATP